MRLPGGDPFTRRRRLLAWSRFEDTPRQLLIELTPAGRYVRQNDEAAALPDLWDTVHELLRGTATPLTRPEITAAWPPDSAPPRDTALWKCLTQATKAGLLRRDGAGTRGKPFRFWLLERDEEAA